MPDAPSILAHAAPEAAAPDAAAPGRATRAELARLWGCSRANVSKLFSRPGAPAFGDDGRIDIAEANRWHSCRAQIRRAAPAVDGLIPEVPAGATIEESRRIREECAARVARIEALRASGDAVLRSDVERVARDDAAVIRTDLLGLPSSVAPDLADAARAGGAPAVAGLLARALRALLLNWSLGLAGAALKAAIAAAIRGAPQPPAAAPAPGAADEQPNP